MPLGRLFSSIKRDRLLSCPTCGRMYKENRQCPREDEHWEDFTSAMDSVREAPATFQPAA